MRPRTAVVDSSWAVARAGEGGHVAAGHTLSTTGDDAAFLAAVRAVRPDLSALLDPGDVVALDSLLLEKSVDPHVLDSIGEILQHNPKALTLVAEELARMTSGFRGIDLPPGPVRPVDADLYRCPVEACATKWERQLPGEAPPLCGQHDVLLVPGS